MFWFRRHMIRHTQPTDRASVRVTRFWIGFERLTLVLSLIASIVAIGGIASWFFEADARDLDRAARVAQAVAGAEAAIERSRGRQEEIGQSGAFKTIIKLGRSSVAVDLDNVTLTGLDLTEGASQPRGRVVEFREVTLRAKRQPIRRPAAQKWCGRGSIINIDFAILNEGESRSGDLCFTGNAYIKGLNAKRGSLSVAAEALYPEELGATALKEATPPKPSSKRDAMWDDPLFFREPLDTETVLNGSSIIGGHVDIRSKWTTIISSNLSGTKVALHGRLIAIVGSSLRGGRPSKR